MPIFFKPSASDFSLSADSIGNRWLQEPVVRPNGFPLYHWIQTERSEGLLTLEGQELLLKPGDGVLIAPHVPHEYRENDGSGMWFTSFLTFDGKLSDDLYKICAVSPYLFVPAPEGAWFQEWIDRIIDSHFLKNDIDIFLQTYIERPEILNRTYMHMLMHCLFRHMFSAKQHEDAQLWDLCCDIAVESVVDSMDYPTILRVTSDFRQEWYEKLEKEVSVLTAEKLYQYFMLHKQSIWKNPSGRIFV